MNIHKFVLKLLFLLIYVVAFANSFFSNAFIDPSKLGLSPAQVLNGILLIIFFIYNISNSSTSDWKFLSPLLILSFFSLISSIWSPFPFIATVFSLKLFFIINVFVLTFTLSKKNILNERKLLMIARRVILITIIGQAIGLFLGINMYDIEYSSAGLFDNGSIISAQMLFALPSMFLSQFKKRIDLIYIFLIFISILFTLRRSALIAFLLILFIVLLLHISSSSNSLRYKLRLLVIGLIITILFVFVLTSTQIGNSFLSRLTELNPNHGSASGRYNFQYSGLQYSLHRDLFPMLFGEGYGSSLEVNVNNGFNPIGMHNDFLDIFIGLGIVGLLFFLHFLQKIWRYARTFPVDHPYFNTLISFSIAILSISFFTGGFYEMNTILGYMSLAFTYKDY
jgi:O-antigen ligase